MLRFDFAAKQYLSYKASSLSTLFFSHLDDIIAQVMQQANVTLPETDRLNNLEKTNKAIILVNSNIDSVSPPSYFAVIKIKHVKKLF